MELPLETRIGHDYERSVSVPFVDLKCPFSNPSRAALAEGNPDEEKIGAFGVGERKHLFCRHGCGQMLD